ncbi:MAG: DUF4268 domain-containing protein [SAR324 cluster bacterium]|nr:DUF4268 domain-containing protein [SAR324 cluster bacterium]
MSCFPRVPTETQKRKRNANSVLPLFWRGLLSQAAERGFKLHSNCRPHSDSRLGVEIGKAGVKFNYAVWQDGSAVELWIDTGNQQENKLIFDRIHAARNKLSKQLNSLLLWERMDEQRPSRIRLELPGSGLKDRSNWHFLQTQMLKVMQRFSSILEKLVHSSVNYSRNLSKVA